MIWGSDRFSDRNEYLKAVASIEEYFPETGDDIERIERYVEDLESKNADLQHKLNQLEKSIAK